MVKGSLLQGSVGFRVHRQPQHLAVCGSGLLSQLLRRVKQEESLSPGL